MIVVLLGATFVFSAWLTVYALFHGGQVDVPNVVGMTRDDARRTVESAGLIFKPRRVHFDAEKPRDAVTEQDPAAGYPVKSGFEIKVDISRGQDPSGASEEAPEPPGPTNPVDPPKDEKKKDRKKPDNTNANANTNAARNTNANSKNTNTATAKPADTNTAKPADNGKPKADPAKDSDAPKLKPKVSKPPSTQ